LKNALEFMPQPLHFRAIRRLVWGLAGLAVWFASPSVGDAQELATVLHRSVLIAQTGAAKTAVGWLIVLLCLLLGLLVVCWPTRRKSPDKK
jgi:hypothetical protein